MNLDIKFCLYTRNIEFEAMFCDFKAKSVVKVEDICYKFYWNTPYFLKFIQKEKYLDNIMVFVSKKSRIIKMKQV